MGAKETVCMEKRVVLDTKSDSAPRAAFHFSRNAALLGSCSPTEGLPQLQHVVGERLRSLAEQAQRAPSLWPQPLPGPEDLHQIKATPLLTANTWEHHHPAKARAPSPHPPRAHYKERGWAAFSELW